MEAFLHGTYNAHTMNESSLLRIGHLALQGAAERYNKDPDCFSGSAVRNFLSTVLLGNSHLVAQTIY